MKSYTSKLIGKTAFITDKDSDWYGYYGEILMYDGDYYHISGGCISSSTHDIVPIFTRNQFVVKRTKV